MFCVAVINKSRFKESVFDPVSLILLKIELWDIPRYDDKAQSGTDISWPIYDIRVLFIVILFNSKLAPYVMYIIWFTNSNTLLETLSHLKGACIILNSASTLLKVAEPS